MKNVKRFLGVGVVEWIPGSGHNHPPQIIRVGLVSGVHPARPHCVFIALVSHVLVMLSGELELVVDVGHHG